MTDTNILLIMCVSTTATHVFLPIRWLVLIAYDAFIVSLYAFFAFGLGGPEQRYAHFYLLQLAALAFVTLVGKRSFENHDRASFARYLTEKSQRVHLEFQLDELHREHGTKEGRKDADMISTATSTSTQHILQELVRAVHQGNSTSKQLDLIAELGKKEHWLITEQDLQIFPSIVLGAGTYGVVVGGCLQGFK